MYALNVNEISALFAGVTLISSLLLYIFAPKKHIFIAAFSVYLLMTAMTACLVVTTGGVTSSFISLWIALTVFASVFGLWGVSVLVLCLASYASYLAMNPSTTTVGSLVIVSVAGLTPLIASYIMFHARPKRDPNDSAFHELATELSQATNKAEVVIRAIDDGVIALNADGNIELMNPAAQRIIGWGNQDAIGLAYDSVLKLTDDTNQPVDEATDPIRQVLATNHDVATKAFYATTNSSKRIVLSLVISPIGQIGQGVIIAFRDITKERAEEREQAEFISTASHEMRTPVASIEGYLGLALNPATAQIDSKAREFIEKAHASAQHLGRLFQDLLDVSKAEDGRSGNHPSVIDVASFVGEVIEGLEPAAKEKGLRLYYKPAINKTDGNEHTLSPVFYMNVDNDHLREIIANLVENAIKYTPQGDVIIDVTGDEEHVNISIQDSGIGIPREDIPHLFQKFYRVDNSATREIGGTGLGLYLCRRLAEMMGGRIWVESEFQKGSTFYLEFPRLARDEASRLIEAAANQANNATTPQISVLHPPEQVASAPQPVPLQPTTPMVVQPLTQAPQPTQPPVATTRPAPTIADIEASRAAQTGQSAAVRVPVRNTSGQRQP